MVEISCFRCQHRWEFEPPMPRADECPKCGWDAHVCMNCQHYDRHAHHACREPQSEFVQDKERANFCDLFAAKLSATSNASQNHQSKLESLFSKGQVSDEVSKANSSQQSIADELQRFLDSKRK